MLELQPDEFEGHSVTKLSDLFIEKYFLYDIVTMVTNVDKSIACKTALAIYLYHRCCLILVCVSVLNERLSILE